MLKLTLTIKEASKVNPKLFNRVFVALTLFLTIFYAVWLGADITRGDTKEAIADGVLLAFWRVLVPG